jgi:thioredoxin-dependent peroxiredoxin
MKTLLRSFAAFTALFTSCCSGSAVRTPPYSAPLVTGTDQDGKAVDFSNLYAAGTTVIYFYPKADTPGCTAQSCSLRDAYAELTEAGVSVVGVSTDTPEKNKAFKEKYKLPFTLISDPKGEILKAFGVKPIPVVGLASRQCFLVEKSQVVWHDDKASTDEQAADIKRVLAERKAAAKS